MLFVIIYLFIYAIYILIYLLFLCVLQCVDHAIFVYYDVNLFSLAQQNETRSFQFTHLFTYH